MRATLPFLLAGILCATERTTRLYDASHGLPNLWVYRLAQDSHGFLWISTHGGLVKFDGGRMMQPEPGIDYDRVRTGPAGEIIGFRGKDIPLADLRSFPPSPVPGPDGRPLLDITDYKFAHDGTLWLIQRDHLLHRNPQGQWSRQPTSFLDGKINDRVSWIEPHGPSGMWVGSNKSLWRIRSPGTPAELVHHTTSVKAARLRAWDRPDGGALLSWTGDRANALYVRAEEPDRIILETGMNAPVVTRGQNILAVDGDGLRRMDAQAKRVEYVWRNPDKREVLSLLADREGSVWIGTARGLVQLPEIDTEIWTKADGLNGDFIRFLRLGPEGLWLGSWQGTGALLKQPDGSWQARTIEPASFGTHCPDAWGTMWGGPRARHKGTDHPLGLMNTGPCLTAADGTVWMGEARLLHTSQALKPADQYPSPMAQIVAMAMDQHGTLWLGGSRANRTAEVVCARPAQAILAGQAPDWRCENIPTNYVHSMTVLPQGRILATTQRGMLEREESGQWKRVMPFLPDGNGISWGPDGKSLWIGSTGFASRVRPTGPLSYELAERLTAWQGFPMGTLVGDIIEEADGSLWVATSLGLVRMPAHVRRSPLPVPQLAVARAVVNGVAAPGRSIEVAAGQSLVEIEFAVPTLRDRRLLRYQYRLSPTAAWSASDAAEPLLRFVNLRPGQHSVELRASLDGVNWSSPQGVLVVVQPPWYTRWWFLALVATAVGALVWLTVRYRVAVALEVERQRNRLARDLHDDLGSTLGSIHILSGLLAAVDLTEPRRADLARRLTQAAASAGGALQDIVFSLNGSARTMQDLAGQLSRRAQDLLPGPDPELRIEFPEEWPTERLNAEACRSLLLIGQEALHNAARHAAATQVVLRFEAVSTGEWRMEIADNGQGFTQNGASGNGVGNGLGNGLGIASIHTRAQALQATAQWLPQHPNGSLVRIQFPLAVNLER